MEKLISSFTSFYDIDRSITSEDSSFCAAAQYHSRCAKYVLVRSAQLWAAETHEYVYFSNQEYLNASNFKSLLLRCIEQSQKLIKPHKEHMLSRVTLIILAENIDEETKRKAKRFHFRKSFRFSFWGWMEVSLAIVDCSNKEVIVNRLGSDVKKQIEKVLIKLHTQTI
jgi:hypothetical protein